MNFSPKNLTRAAMVAALYAALTLIFQPISFGPVQFRVAEALTLLPILTVDAVPGLFVGCLLANLLCGAMWYDVIFGSIATLLAAWCTYRLRKIFIAAASMPVLFNGLIVGPVVYFAYSKTATSPFSLILLLKDVLTVTLGEAAVCYILGFFFTFLLARLPKQLWK